MGAGIELPPTPMLSHARGVLRWPFHARQQRYSEASPGSVRIAFSRLISHGVVHRILESHRTSSRSPLQERGFPKSLPGDGQIVFKLVLVGGRKMEVRRFDH